MKFCKFGGLVIFGFLNFWLFALVLGFNFNCYEGIVRCELRLLAFVLIITSY